jgi:transcriptional regulator with XRE-family HTH domain
MGNEQPRITEFRERLKVERKRRGWTQADVAKMLSDKGIDHIFTTTVAKLESGERDVKLQEATALADLFDVSLDSMLGRSTGLQDDATATLRAVLDTARRASTDLDVMIGALQDRFRALAAFEFDNRDALEKLVEGAADALLKARDAMFWLSAFEMPETGARLRAELIDQAAHNRLLKLIEEMEGRG